MALENFEPKEVLYYFEELSKIPRETFHTKRVSDFCVKFAEDLGLEHYQDEANNVVIKKPGTPGYENADPVILQGHLDMVCEKVEGSTHDFRNDPLDVDVKDGFIYAKGTSLGGDDGIAIAYTMAILASKDIPHPPIEALFTVDEETGMGGAIAIDMSILKGRKLINIDSEQEGTLVVGCEGGYENVLTLPVEREEKEGTVFNITLKGLKGGHSGMEIHKQRGNANKLLGRLLMNLREANANFSLIDINGGSKPNVITPAAVVNFVACPCCVESIRKIIADFEATIREEFSNDENGLIFEVKETEGQTVKAMTKESTKKVVFLIAATPDGVQCFSRDIAGLVETSTNLGVLVTKESAVEVTFRVRSALKSKKANMKTTYAMWADFLGADIRVESEYPAWEFKADSELRPLMINTYKDLFGEEPKVETIHAGLECGLFAGKVEGLDSVSFGPNMSDVHSINEKLEIASVQRMWKYLKEILKNCK